MALMNSIPEIFDVNKMPGILYHYTSMQGLKGIVADGAVHASDFRYLNDYDEVLHLIRHVVPRCDGLIEELCHFLSSSVSEKNLPQNEMVPKYLIASFSECPDDIAMWGRYTNDSGVALGFESGTVRLGTPAQDKFQQPVIGKCIYKEEQKTAIAQRVVDSLIKGKIPPYDGRLIMDFAIAFLRLGPFFKNESFANEREWRVVFEHSPGGSGKPIFRVSQNLIVPYMGLSFLENQEDRQRPARMYLPRIVLSPKAKHNHRTKGSIEDFLIANDVEWGEIIESGSSII